MAQQQCNPILSVTRMAQGTIAANRFVTHTSVAGVTQAVADAATLGVTRTAAVTGEYIAIDVLGTTIVEAGAAVLAGATLESDASGRAVTWATSGNKVGVALTTATGAGDFIEVMLIPNG